MHYMFEYIVHKYIVYKCIVCRASFGTHFMTFFLLWNIIEDIGNKIQELLTQKQ